MTTADQLEIIRVILVDKFWHSFNSPAETARVVAERFGLKGLLDESHITAAIRDTSSEGVMTQAERVQETICRLKEES